MKNLVLAILLLGIWGQSAVGQERSPYTFSLNGVAVSPKPNFQQEKKVLKVQGLKKPDQAEYLILQFAKIPTNEERAKLAEEGITLLDYIQGNAFFVAISPKFYAISRAESTNLRAIMPILPEYKIEKSLLEAEIPTHARGSKGKVNAIVSYFEGADMIRIKSDISSITNCSIKGTDEDFRNISVEVRVSDLTKLAEFAWVKSIEMIAPPSEFENTKGKNGHRANVLNSQIRGLGYGLTGKGVKLGLWDSDVDHHRDFGTRVINREFEIHTTDHGTHTAGTIGSAGILDPTTRGMAPEVTIYAWNFNLQSNGLSEAQERLKSIKEDGIELTSNSFGSKVKTCPNTIKYSYSNANEDLIAYKYPYFLFVYSGGNDQTACPGGFKTTSKNIKNSLVVAAIDSLNNMSSFSSFGPSSDGRLIPNISGDGVNVYSTFLNNKYGYMDGTSMATPGVAGTMALLYQRYKDTHGGVRPTSALLRALACNTATDLGNAGPDYKFGYGAINGMRAIQVMESNSMLNAKVEQNKVFSKTISVPAGAAALKVMLAWTDNYGTPGTARILVNNIDLKVSNGATEYLPWVLNPLKPNTPAVRSTDQINNLEQVTINNPTPGTYTITVQGTEVPNGTQDFAIVYDVVMPYLTLTYPIGGESLAPLSKAVITWNSEGYTGKYTLEYSTDGGQSYNTIASDIPNKQNTFSWEVPNGVNTANAKIRVSSGSEFSETKLPFNIMASPLNIKIEELSCGGTGSTITWNPIANATYEVLKLNGETYEHLGDATTNSYNVVGLTPSSNNYFCVRAIDKTTQAVSERSVAVTANPAIAVNTLPIKENFESQSAPNFTFTRGNGQSAVQFVTDAQRYGIRLEGPSEKIAPDWNTTSTTPTDCFSNNAAYISKAGICNINATSMEGKKFFLKFDFRQKYRTAAGTSYFRVKINGVPVTSLDGDEVYGSKNTERYKTVYYDLTPFAGMASLNVVFEAVCNTGYTTYLNSNYNYDFSNDSNDKGDFVTIDNVEFYEPPIDAAITSLTVTKACTATETVSVKVKNFSSSSFTSIPVSYQLDNEAAVNEVITTPLPPFGEVSYTFSQKADLSAEGSHNIAAKVSIEGDKNSSNDTKSVQCSTDLSYKMVTGTKTITVCGATITDAGGKYSDYPTSVASILTIKPTVAGKNTRITFSEFETEEDYDYLEIYDGATSTSPLLGRFDGKTTPPSFTSTAAGGELTLKFKSDPVGNYKGFVVYSDCVEKPKVDMAITAITRPILTTGIKTTSETIACTVKNGGTDAIASYDVYYQVDNNTPIKETFTTNLASGTSTTLSFATKANFATPASYALKVWVNVRADAVTANNTMSTTITSLPNITDLGIASVSPIIPARGLPTTITATLQNYGTQSLSGPFTIAYRINGGVEVTQSYTSASKLYSNDNVTITFATKADLSAQKDYTVEVYLKMSADANESNDKQTVVVAKAQNAKTNVVGSFDGESTSVIANATPAIDLINNYTIEAWVKLSDPTTYGHIFDKTNIILRYNTNYGDEYYRKNSFILNVNKSSENFVFFVPNSVKKDTWQHIALTVSNGNVYTLYIDGKAQKWNVYSGTEGATKTNANNPISIGNRPTDLIRSANGYIDEVRVWNSALDQPTIASNMMTDYTAGTAGLLAYYKFKEGNGAYVYDYSSNDNTALISNADVSGMGAGKFWNQPGNLLQILSVKDEITAITFDEATNTYKAVMDKNPLNAIVAKFIPEQQSTIKIGETPQVSGVTSNDFSKTATISYTVKGVGFNSGIDQNFHLNVSNDLSSKCTLSSFSFEPASNSSITTTIALDNVGTSFTKKVSGIDASGLKASFKISENSKLIINDEVQTSPQSVATNYSKPLIVKVKSENGRYSKTYLVDLNARSNAAELTAFSIPEYQVGTTTIDQKNHTVKLVIKPGSNLSQIVPKFEISPKASLFVGSIIQKSETTVNNLATPLTLSVVSEDETTTTDYMVSVSTNNGDNIKPTITIMGNALVTIAAGTTYTDQGATAADDIDGDITKQIVPSGTVNTAIPGTYTITYTVTDAAGNTGTASRTVKVVDQTNPVITLNGNATLYTTYGETFTDPSVTATDNVDGNISGSVVTTGVVNTEIVGSYTLTYNVKDAAGNNANEVTRTVVVGKATAGITIKNLSQVFNTKSKEVTITTTPANLNVTVTYNGSRINPIGTGMYEVIATINDKNYEGSQKATLQITLGSLVREEEANSAYIYSNARTIFVNIKEVKNSASLKIFNSGGGCVYESNMITSGMNQVNKTFIPGMYIVWLNSDGVIYNQKVIIVN